MVDITHIKLSGPQDVLLFARVMCIKCGLPTLALLETDFNSCGLEMHVWRHPTIEYDVGIEFTRPCQECGYEATYEWDQTPRTKETIP